MWDSSNVSRDIGTVTGDPSIVSSFDCGLFDVWKGSENDKFVLKFPVPPVGSTKAFRRAS